MLRTATEQLAAADSQAFLKNFDPKMEGYATIAQQVSFLVAREGASSSIEVVKDSGDDLKRTMELDWVLRAGARRRIHQVVKVVLEKREGKWRFTSFTPANFFAVPE